MGCYICQDATQIVQEDPFLCNCFIVPEAPRLFRGAEPEAYFQPPKGILDRVLRKRYNPPTDGDGVCKPVPEFFAVGIDRTTFPEVHVKDGVR